MSPVEWDDTTPVQPLLDPVPIHIRQRGVDPVCITDHHRLDGLGFSVSSEMRLTTERSIWLLRPDTYFRMPRAEAARQQERSIEGRMDDGRWHEYRRAWFFVVAGAWLHVGILPAVGPPDGKGIYTGRIASIGGTWQEVKPEPSGVVAGDGGRDD